jgi:hypothetical protein
MGKIEFKKVQAGVQIRQVVGGQTAVITIPLDVNGGSRYLETAGDWLQSFHPVDSVILIGGNEMTAGPE